MKGKIDTVTLELGITFIPVIGTGDIIKSKVQELRENLRSSHDFILPSIHLYERPDIVPYNKFVILLNGEVKKEGELKIKEEEKMERFDSTLTILVKKLEETIIQNILEKNEDEGGKGTT